MKKIILIVVLVSSIIVGQSSTQKTILNYQLSTLNFQNQNPNLTRPQSKQVNPQLLALQIPEHSDSISNYQLSIINYQLELPETSDMRFEMPNIDAQKKSPGLAILYSLILPGMGELYAGGYESGKYFTIADGVLWGTFAGFSLYGNWKKSNYETFAESNAGASMENKDEEFKANVGVYMSQDEYNRTMELERSFEKTYNSKTYYWNWRTNEDRKEYRDMWTSSEAALNNVRFVVGALILNRVVSAINAVRLVSAYNKNISQEISWNLYFGVDNKITLPQSLTINFVKHF